MWHCIVTGWHHARSTQARLWHAHGHAWSHATHLTRKRLMKFTLQHSMWSECHFHIT